MQSENINELAGALAKAQGSIKAAAKAKAAEDDAWPDWDTAPDPRELN